MRRLGLIAVVSLALVAIAAPVVNAGQGSTHTPKVPTFVAKTNTAVQGGNLRIVAKVKHPDRAATYTATATVHFASGDVTVELTRRGKSFVAGGKAPVSETEATGTVLVDVTITYNGTPQPVQTEGTINPADD